MISLGYSSRSQRVRQNNPSTTRKGVRELVIFILSQKLRRKWAQICSIKKRMKKRWKIWWREALLVFAMDVLNTNLEGANQIARVVITPKLGIIMPGTHSSHTLAKNNFAIVFQGGVASSRETEYFEETLRQVRLALGDVPVFWGYTSNSSSSTAILAAKDLGVDVISVEDPGVPDFTFSQNFLRQLHSTAAGLKNAGLANEYALKIRTDQRMDFNRIKLFEHQISSYDNRDNASDSSLILGSSLNSYLNRPVGLSDMLLFGRIKNLSSYFPVLTRDEFAAEFVRLNERFTDEQWGQLRWPEGFLAARYFSLHDQLESSPREATLKFWTKFAGIVDSIALSHEWLKQLPWMSSSYAGVNWFHHSAKWLGDHTELSSTEWQLNVESGVWPEVRA